MTTIAISPTRMTAEENQHVPQQPTATQKRARQPLLGLMFSIQALLPRLPLLFPVDSQLPPSPKLRYRSHYRYPGPDALLEKDKRTPLSDFEVALYLIDFSPLEKLFARIYVSSHKGQVPFHPVSMFLSICLRRQLHCSWGKLAKLLAGEHGAGWRKLFGFADADTPSPSGLRYFFNTVGEDVFAELCPRFVDLLRQHGLFPEHSTYPGDDEDRGVSASQDGMLHPARSRPSCQLATNGCYQPLTEEQKEGKSTPKRPCRAQEKGLPGCNCDSSACQERCERASRLDSEARFIHYEGNKNNEGGREGKSKGVDVFGYRSIAERVIDDRFAIAWTLRSTLYSANTDERTVFVPHLHALTKRFRDLKIGEWLDDAGVAYEPCLEAIWQLGALRMVDIRGDESDKNFDACVTRGYDGEGYPLCPHGYRLLSNGYDYQHRRRKWICAQSCRRKPRREGEAVKKVEGCPYLERERPLGFIVNVGKTLPKGNMRLARDIPYGSDEWKARYGRRNLSESRNGQLEGLGLKRMQSYGLERNAKEVQAGDFILNLHTLGRLVREATALSES